MSTNEIMGVHEEGKEETFLEKSSEKLIKIEELQVPRIL